jgi:hypothetical protein
MEEHLHGQEITKTEPVMDVSDWPPGTCLAVVYPEGRLLGRSKFVMR